MSVILELNHDSVEVEYSASVYHPAKLTGHPDSWCPAEGGEIEIEEVRYTTSGHVRVDGRWVRFDTVRIDVMPLLSDSEIERFQDEIANLKEDYEP